MEGNGARQFTVQTEVRSKAVHAKEVHAKDLGRGLWTEKDPANSEPLHVGPTTTKARSGEGTIALVMDAKVHLTYAPRLIVY